MNDDTVRRLRELNFQQLIRLDHQDVTSYTFGDYRKGGFRHPAILGYCVDCDQKQLHEAVDGSGFTLKNISHGATSEDFFDALPPEKRPNHSTLRVDPVMFVLEAPSINFVIGPAGEKLYQITAYQTNSRTFEKCPTRQWYWVHHELSAEAYPERFWGQEYGKLILSVLFTFELGNAYITNLVKCGMTDAGGRGYKGINHFPQKCVANCYTRFLRREIEIMSPKVIFAFGSAVALRVRDLLRNDPPKQECKPIIQQLPHPAGRRRGFSDEYYQILYYWLILRGLIRAGIVKTEDALKLARTFIDNEYKGQSGSH